VKTIQFIIIGRVQGVAFRYYTKQSAEKLQIMGSVKNLFDGTVEVIAQGEEGQLALFEAYLFKGSPYSEVEKIEKVKKKNTVIYHDFKIIL